MDCQQNQQVYWVEKQHYYRISSNLKVYFQSDRRVHDKYFIDEESTSGNNFNWQYALALHKQLRVLVAIQVYSRNEMTAAETE